MFFFSKVWTLTHSLLLFVLQFQILFQCILFYDYTYCIIVIHFAPPNSINLPRSHNCHFWAFTCDGANPMRTPAQHVLLELDGFISSISGQWGTSSSRLIAHLWDALSGSIASVLTFDNLLSLYSTDRRDIERDVKLLVSSDNTKGGWELCFHPNLFICLSEQDMSKSYGQIWPKLGGQVVCVMRSLFDFGEDPDPDMIFFFF